MTRRKPPMLRIGARVRLCPMWYLPFRLALRAETGTITAAGPDVDIWSIRLDQPAVWIWPDGSMRRGTEAGSTPHEDLCSIVFERADCLELLA